MTVCLDETVTITETTYKISVETYNEIQEIAQETPLPIKIGGKEEAEPAGTMTSLLVRDKLPYCVIKS